MSSVLFVKPEGKWLWESHKRWWEENIKLKLETIDLKEIGGGYFVKGNKASYSIKYWNFVN
jgi:hypothetical protein